MKLVLWGVFVLVAALWTGGAALTAQLVQWSAQGLASGAGAQVGEAVAAVSVPAWLAPWIDPAAWAAMQQAIGGVLAGTADLLPGLGGLVGWLTPAIWVFWGIGMALLLALTLAGHWLIQRLRPPLRVGPQGL